MGKGGSSAPCSPSPLPSPTMPGRAYLQKQRDDDLTVRTRQRCVGRLQARIQLLVVVNLSIGRHNDLVICAAQRLRARFGVDNGQPLVRYAVVVVHEVPAPVRPAVPQALGALDQLASQLDVIEPRAEDAQDAAHGGSLHVRAVATHPHTPPVKQQATFALVRAVARCGRKRWGELFCPASSSSPHCATVGGGEGRFSPWPLTKKARAAIIRRELSLISQRSHPLVVIVAPPRCAPSTVCGHLWLALLHSSIGVSAA